MTDPAAPTTPENLNAETWGSLAEAIRQYAKSGSDLDWPAVEQAMRDRDAFHRAAIEAEARSTTPAEALDVPTEIAAMALHRWKHPSFQLGEYRCRCRDDAELAIRLLRSPESDR